MACRQVLSRGAMASRTLRSSSRLSTCRPASLAYSTTLRGAGSAHEYSSQAGEQSTVSTKEERAKMTQAVRTFTTRLRHSALELTPNEFPSRHIGPRDEDIGRMLAKIGNNSGMEDFIDQVIPKDLQQPFGALPSDSSTPEPAMKKRFNNLMKECKSKIYYTGRGYYPSETPSVIKRNILENPGWYTSYTPYQAEISQGRLESLLNYQTMVSDLTGLPVANSSLLDEGTAGAEAMTMSINTLPTSRLKRANKTYVVSNQVLDATAQVLQGRAEGFGVKIVSMDLDKPDSISKLKEIGDDLVGVMVQYPTRDGLVEDYSAIADAAHELGVQVSAATDLSALTVLKPPGEWGADIAFGNSQRFGVPLGFGGPHAAFFATKEVHKRRIPGRIIGVTKDRLGRPAMRLALQTREQHIRREKATSNVCTAQALLANMAAMYAVYHGPAALKRMAVDNIRKARVLADIAQRFGYTVKSSASFPGAANLSDTVTLTGIEGSTVENITQELWRTHSIGVFSDAANGTISFSVSQNLEPAQYRRITQVLFGASQGKGVYEHSEESLAAAEEAWLQAHGQADEAIFSTLPDTVRRQSTYLTHPVFNTHHSETEILRYIHHLQSRDLSQAQSMIPLGSCTMKLNATTELELIGHPVLANMHPMTPKSARLGLDRMISELETQLSIITGLSACSIQPNSGAQGEFAGLRVIRKYHQNQDSNKKRDICLIPVSAHGTNPASAAMAGMRTVPIKCDSTTGNLDLADLEAKCVKHADELGAVMITYPSTYGVFEPDVKKAITLVHDHGGLVYMDGANMNAQIGLTSPGALGADVCHLNLHKTFCIPHGGGGPGVGPICVNDKLAPYLPNGEDLVSSHEAGSASILPISWSYIHMMHNEGLLKATKVALLNANYLLARLRDHYQVVYTNDKGRCAHEFIIDIRPFGKSAGIDVADIAKRLQDYGFHSPTMSWPVPGTLMIEPTESESKAELDRFADALISIRQEIREIEDGKQPREGNVLKMAPHPQLDLIRGDGEGKWERAYSREKAAYPLPYLLEKKFWPTVGRADDTYGDTNLFCTCPPVEDTTQQDY